MGGIYWLASYPRSGSTWFRTLLCNLLADADEPADINQVGDGAIASYRCWIDDVLTFDSADLTGEETERLRPRVYGWAASGDQIGYHKIHDAFTLLPDGEPLVSRGGTLGAVYLVRNPLDVVSSLADHIGCTLDQAINRMGDPESRLGGRSGGLGYQVPARLLTWSAHVASWIDASGLRCELIRYEDLAARPVETFSRAAAFLGLLTDRSRLEKAVRFSAFSELRRQEQEHGFTERSPASARFFRRGEVGAWRGELTHGQVECIVADHGPMMRRLGYLDPDNDG